MIIKTSTTNKSDAVIFSPDTSYFSLMIEWLRTKDKEKNEAATAILCRLGQPVVEFLVQEVVGPQKRPDHRVRILDVIQQIGTPLGPQEYFGITSLLAHRSVKVRVKAAEVLDALSLVGPRASRPQ